MGSYRIHNQDAVYFLTYRIVGWVDIFTRKIYKDLVIDSLAYCRKNKGLLLYGYVIMSNHIHLLVQSLTGDLSGFTRDFKRHTSRNIIDYLKEGNESRAEWINIVFQYHGKFQHGQTFQIWARDDHAEEVYNQRVIEQKLQYIHDNPVKAGIVVNPEDYLYSSARNYDGLDSVIQVECLDMCWKSV